MPPGVSVFFSNFLFGIVFVAVVGARIVFVVIVVNVEAVGVAPPSSPHAELLPIFGMAPVDAAGALIGLNAPGVAFLVAFATIPPLPPFLAYIVVVVVFSTVLAIVVFASLVALVVVVSNLD